MTIESIMQLVGQCAFPIVRCICMFSHMTETSKENTDSINKLCVCMFNHMTETSEKNTDSINKLCNKIDMLLDRDTRE